jgi:spermidine synthase
MNPHRSSCKSRTSTGCHFDVSIRILNLLTLQITAGNRLAIILGFTASLAGSACRPPDPGFGAADPHGKLVHSEKSGFSNIRIRENGSVRSLYFVEASGLEVRQTSVDLKHPGRLLVPYTRTMFASFLFKYPQERVLIVGLGGGSMVRFLNHHFPQTAVDAVEIDPLIVNFADVWFGTGPGPRTRIFTEDAIRYLQRDVGRYDVIYMDAFLEPGADTDSRGIPRRLKTVDFLKSLHHRLTPGGVVAFNLIEQASLARDLQTIGEAFPSTYRFRVPGTRNVTIIASPDALTLPAEVLQTSGRRLGHFHSVGFSFERLVDLMEIH